MSHHLDHSSLVAILIAPAPSFKQRLAASELQRGLRQLGVRGTVAIGEWSGISGGAGLRFVLTNERGSGDNYSIRARAEGSETEVYLHGVNEQALLYAVFDFLERQGALFGIDGDSYPLTQPQALELPAADAAWTASPRFAVRGLLPWPDFLNCISVYNREDWRGIPRSDAAHAFQYAWDSRVWPGRSVG